MSFRLVLGAAGVLVLCVAPASAQSALERGRYLVEGIAACGNCHTPKGPGGVPVADKNMAGGFEIREAFGRAVASNITPDKETGIGNWTDDQIVKAMREGVRPDGSIIGPPMAIELYRGISDRDARAIVVYLRSLPAVKNAVAKSQYTIPLPPNYGPPVGSVADVAPADKVKYGEYLAGPIGHCIECHTPMERGRIDRARLGQGGMEFRGPWGVSTARNITPHPTDGLGAWSDAEIKRAITAGVSRAGNQLFPPMGYAYYAKATDGDLDAIVAYLRSLKPLPMRQ